MQGQVQPVWLPLSCLLHYWLRPSPPCDLAWGDPQNGLLRSPPVHCHPGAQSSEPLRLPGQGIHSSWKSQAAPARAPQPTQLGVRSLVPQGCQGS